MNLEIERKFLVKNDSFKLKAFEKKYLKQGFLNSNKDRTVRVRVLEDTAFLTIKGRSNTAGTTRFEWEKEISVEDAQELMLLTEEKAIEKYRYFIQEGKHVFEVDEFLGENAGLIVAEIELSKEDECFSVPDWLGKEITGDVQYYNSSLSKSPFCTW